MTIGPILVLAVLLAGGVGAVLYALWRGQISSQASLRLRPPAEVDEPGGTRTAIRRSRIVARYLWVAGIAALVVAGLVLLLTPWPWPYAVALGFLTAMVGWQLESVLFQHRQQKAEQQLADSIDMMVAAVKSGASLQGALESAMENTPRPWRTELEEVVSRIRFGDDPVAVLGDLTARLPLETVRLFAQTLAVNWSVGGRLSQTLANVSRTIRDRLELSRRMNAMTTQGRLSVLIILIVTYFIAALIWRNDPDRMASFLGSFLGQILVAVAIILQGVGVIWISRLCQPKF